MRARTPTQLNSGVVCKKLVAMENSSCPLFTEQHGKHSAVWSISGFTLPVFCIACVTERLEDKRELNLHFKKILSELKALMSPGKDCELLVVLNSDKRVFERLCGRLFGIWIRAYLYCTDCKYFKFLTNLVFLSDPSFPVKGC